MSLISDSSWRPDMNDFLQVALELVAVYRLFIGQFVMQHLAVADDAVQGCAQFVADVGQEHALCGIGLVGGIPGIADIVHGIAQFVGHVIERGRQVAQFTAVLDILDAVIEVAAADSLGAGLQPLE